MRGEGEIEVVETGFLYRPLIVRDLNGDFHLRHACPEAGVTEKQFNAQCQWRDSENSAARRRGAVRCLQAHEGTSAMSPINVPEASIPADILAEYDAAPADAFLFRPVEVAA